MAKDLEAPKPFVPSVFADGDKLDAGNVEEMRFGLAGSGPLAKAVLDSNAVGTMRQLVGGGATPTTTIPVGTISPYAGTSAPANWLLCDGSAVSRVTYAALFAVTSTAYGAGDGSTTFNVPDLRGRVVAGLDNMGGTAASRLTSTSGIVGTTLGAAGGDQRIQDHTHTFSGTTGNDSPDHSHSIGKAFDASAYGWNIFGGGAGWTLNGSTNTSGASTRHTHPFSGTTANHNQVAGGASQNVQPTVITSYIIKAVADVSNTFGVALAGAAGGDLAGTYPNPTLNATLTDAIQKSRAMSNIQQTVNTSMTAYSYTGTWVDIMTVSITPTFNTSKILARWIVNISPVNGNDMLFRLTRNSTDVGSGTLGSILNAAAYQVTGSGDAYSGGYSIWNASSQYLDSPATTSAITYRVQIWVYSGGPSYLNRRYNDSAFGLSSSVIVQEMPVW